MKAAVCHEFGKPLVIEDLTIDPPEAGEVRVKLAACAICHSDIHYAEGAWGGSLPAVYGHEAAGVVEEVGPGVQGFAAGDHVVVTLIRACGHCFHCDQAAPFLCDEPMPLDEASRLRNGNGRPILQGLKTGAFAEEAVVHHSQIVKIPADLPLESASLLACGVITGLGAVVNTAQVPAGSSVAVIGTGGVGLNSVQGAALCGAQTIIALDLSDDKLASAKAFGATHTINPKRNDAQEAVKAVTQGRGADYVFVTVGVAAAIGVMGQFEVLSLADDCKRIVGSKMGGTRLKVDVPKLVELYRQGRLKLDELITGRYPLERINEAIASVNRGEALRNVIVF